MAVLLGHRQKTPFWSMTLSLFGASILSRLLTIDPEMKSMSEHCLSSSFDSTEKNPNKSRISAEFDLIILSTKN
ncbi:hypothetical protein BpHYR1_022320 [Brachionus plicatilis]|uniref:Uncharacterized protein n=1 Tax=Brachionus plicatilis TaxID=10195 RepID=A0A3M7S4V6_BRAPC|nr:hypothetical protein BpHYR1_022320 [Brachionus plicatilis]